jgi:hypothetical protein
VPQHSVTVYPRPASLGVSRVCSVRVRRGSFHRKNQVKSVRNPIVCTFKLHASFIHFGFGVSVWGLCRLHFPTFRCTRRWGGERSGGYSTVRVCDS